MNDVPRYATLRDYLRVLQRNRLVILVALVLFGAGGYLLTAGDKPLYRAQASDAFQDSDLQTFNLIGVSANPTNEAVTRVQINAASITRPAVVATVAQLLPRVPPRLLTSGVSTTVNTATGFLVIQVESPDAVFAQQLANAYARAVAVVERSYDRSRFAAAAKRIQQVLASPQVRANQVEYTNFAQRLRDLQFASVTANPVSVVGNAAVPTAPVSPHPIRDALLGLLLGLTLGVIVAFARDALDRRLRGSDQITETLNWPILGHIREDTLGKVGFIATDRSKLGAADLEGYRILRQNIQYLNVDEPPRSIVVTSARPEEGKSSVAASLACASALTGRRTLLIDCDLRRPTLAKRLDVPAEPGLSDYLLGDAEPAQILRSVPLGSSPSPNGDRAGTTAPQPHSSLAQLVFIPSGRPTPYPAELLSSQRLRKFLAEVTAVYELVVIDTAPILPVADALGVLPEAQATLLCVRASQTTGNELRAAREAIDRLPAHPTGVVITGIRSGSELDFGYYAHEYQYR